MLWTKLDAKDRAALDAAGARRSYRAGEVLFREGEPPTHVLVVLRGRARLTTRALDGREVMIELRGPGQLLGELGVIGETPRVATATALDPMETVVITAVRFRQLLTERAALACAVLEIVSEKLQQSTTRRLELGAASTLGRLCQRLVELADDQAPAAEGVVDVDLPMTQRELAEWIGASRDAVVVALRQIRTNGWAETGRRRIRIHDLAALRRAALV